MMPVKPDSESLRHMLRNALEIRDAQVRKLFSEDCKRLVWLLARFSTLKEFIGRTRRRSPQRL